MGRRRRKHLHLRGVELTRFALLYCFQVRGKLGLPQKEGGLKILCNLPPVWPRLVRPTNLMSRMDGKKTHTHTHRYICLVFIPSPALLQKNKQASDWVDAEEKMPPIGTLWRKHLDLSAVELTRCVFRGLRLGGKSSYNLYTIHYRGDWIPQ